VSDQAASPLAAFADGEPAFQKLENGEGLEYAVIAKGKVRVHVHACVRVCATSSTPRTCLACGR
jgi:hypothetical protein